MKKTMSSIERIRAALKGEPVDRVPYAFWSHLPEIDRDPERLSAATIKFVADYDLDFIKTMANGMYAVEDFGCVCDFSEVARGGVARLVSTPVSEPADWSRIRPMVADAPALARELRTLELVLKELKGKVPVLFTIFSPMTIAEKLSCGRLRDHLDAGVGEPLHQALTAIAETTAALSRKAIKLGADGVFFASQTATDKLLSLEEHRTYGKRYDLLALEGAAGGWCNAVHIHGESVYFDEFCDYPVQILNWHVWEAAPEIASAMKKTDKCLMGGLKRFSITENNVDEISAQIWASLAQSGCRRHILTPGCVVRLPVPERALRHVGQTLADACEVLLG